MAAAIVTMKLDLNGAMHSEFGVTETELAALQPAVVQAQKEVLEADAKAYSSGKVPAEKDPLDHGFLDLPDRLLAEYQEKRAESELGRIMTAAAKLREKVDRVVVLGIGGSYMGAKALMDACCQPYYNELTRAERGGYPRIYFEGNNIDNDASQGLLHLLGTQQGTTPETRWGIVVISKSGETLETAVAFRQFTAALVKSCGGDLAKAAELIIPVTGVTGRLADLSLALGCKPEVTFPVPDGVGGRFSILSAVGLVPAALMGLDILRLLQGASLMTKHFREAKPDENLVLQFVSVCHLMETRRMANLRILCMWSKALECAGLWYDQLLAESLGKRLLGATPLTTVNTRDLHSRAQQHQQGRRDKLFVNVIVDKWRFDALPVGKSDFDQDKLNDIAGKTMPELMTAAIQGTNEAYKSDGRPTIDLHLPTTDVTVMGQYFQWLMIANVVEGRLLGINPYGQPGVQMYKGAMKRILGR
ncbi:Glucose-6-phosphate isomerase [Anatilimnocola aggregata]|uniref:Glucose-6-phosphate isomerase n=1 Tax=Anatilimnocola aggregata TaxID=2528021 RepID=A0A517YJL3_9BACT|nr:glucose-6-phosphate isomerase [Anatilimnocola aggregata]QDU30413.1 Glucose-6-phosphate isomerase [Anatilimnocola aggregata]